MSYEKTIYRNRYYNFHPHGMRPHASVVFRMDSCCCRSGDRNVGQRGGVSLARRSCHHALERMPLRMEKGCRSFYPYFGGYPLWIFCQKRKMSFDKRLANGPTLIKTITYEEKVGRLAQWESASLTRKRPLVRYQYRPPLHSSRLTRDFLNMYP